MTTMAAKKRWFPFTAEQSVNILSEFGPLVTMFVVNAITGSVEAGTWALIISTLIAIGAMRIVLGRLPIFPIIASAVTIAFGALTIYTHDAFWIKKKVTIFNVMFGVFLLVGLRLKKNFFKHVFEKTFHYTDEGWNKFTLSFSLFFFLTAILNEVIIQLFDDHTTYVVLGQKFDGVSIWILFKVAIIMPLSGIYAWYLTRVMQRYRIEDPGEHASRAAPDPASHAPDASVPDASGAGAPAQRGQNGLRSEPFDPGQNGAASSVIKADPALAAASNARKNAPIAGVPRLSLFPELGVYASDAVNRD